MSWHQAGKSVSKATLPEEQIRKFVKMKCERECNGEHFFVVTKAARRVNVRIDSYVQLRIAWEGDWTKVQ